MRETNHAVKEEKRTCTIAKPTPTPINTPGWTTMRHCANCPATRARENSCSTSAPRRSRWPSCWPSSYAPAPVVITSWILQTNCSRSTGDSPAEAANLVMLNLAYLDTEQMRILLLDAKGQLVEKISSYH